tara:strand:- start:159 stop:407 length:249 start_codon:yes stop_codon:yes gene_type:complete
MKWANTKKLGFISADATLPNGDKITAFVVGSAIRHVWKWTTTVEEYQHGGGGRILWAGHANSWDEGKAKCEDRVAGMKKVAP